MAARGTFSSFSQQQRRSVGGAVGQHQATGGRRQDNARRPAGTEACQVYGHIVPTVSSFPDRARHLAIARHKQWASRIRPRNGFGEGSGLTAVDVDERQKQAATGGQVAERESAVRAHDITMDAANASSPAPSTNATAVIVIGARVSC
jgi:hypothetical protein